MKKKAIAMMLVTALTGSMLAGCGSGSTSADADAGKGAEKESTAADETEDGLMNPEGLPLVDEEGAYSFSIFCDDSTSTGEFYMLDEFKKQTNVDVELRYYPYDTATERLNLDLNSGNYADVIGGWTLSDSMILTYGVEQGVFIPLDEIYEKYCPNISAILDLPGVREQMTAPDGHIYTIPYVCGDTTVSFSPYINGRWLENVGMDMPSTTEEFEAVLKAFKEQDANGNGDPNDEIPFTADPNNKHLEAMTGYFGLPMNKNGLSIQNGETVYAGISPQYRQFLSWFNKLYEQGLVDPEIFTQDSATWEGKGNQDRYGVGIAFGSAEFSGLIQGTEKGEFDPLPVLNTDKGGIWLRDTTGFSVYRTQAVITDNAEHPEIIARWFDNAFELENGIGCGIGPVDVVVFKEDDGYHKIDVSTLDPDFQEKISWANLWPQSLPKYTPKDFKVIEANPAFDEHKLTEQVYEADLTDDVIPSFWVDMDAVEVYAELTSSLRDYFNQQQALFIAGEQDVDDDAQWQAYIDGMKALELDEWLDICGVSKIVE